MGRDVCYTPAHMSRVKQFKRIRKRQEQRERPAPSKRQQIQQLPIQQQLNMLFTGIGHLADHLSEIELKVEFTMRQFKLRRPKAGGLILEGGKPQFEETTMLEFYLSQREQFAAVLQKERHEALRAELAAKGIDPDKVLNGNSGHADEADAAAVLERVASHGDGSGEGADADVEIPKC